MRANKAITGSPGIRRGKIKLMVNDTHSVTIYRPICFSKYFIQALSLPVQVREITEAALP
jgi:hypothetical protein